MTNRICRLFERGARQTTARARGAKGQRGRHPLSDPHSRTKELPPVKIPRSIIFYSHADSNYRLYPTVEWMRNFFHLLESWQFDNHRATAGVWAAKVLNLFFFSPPDSQESLFLQLFSSAFFVLTHLLFLDRFYFPLQISCILNALYSVKPWPFLEVKKGKMLSHVSLRLSRWPSQWSTRKTTMSKQTLFKKKKVYNLEQNKTLIQFLHCVYSYVR